MELPTLLDSFAVTAEEAERITIMLEKQFASRFTDLDKGNSGGLFWGWLDNRGHGGIGC